MYIEILRGKKGYFWHIVGNNGQIVVSSQRYHSRSNAKRAALRLAEVNYLPVKLKRAPTLQVPINAKRK